MIQQRIVKAVLNKHKKRDNWFLDDYSVNPYEGCSCNCLYCYIRGSKYGENMDSGMFVKSNVAAVLEKQLQSRAKKNQYGIVAIGSSTDAYMPHEATWGVTEQVLQLMLKYRFPVFISTKSALITRDIDLLKAIDKTAILPADLSPLLKNGVILSVSVSTLDHNISNMLEPGAITPKERFALVRRLKDAGFLVGINAIPLLPYISDSDETLENIIAEAKISGADYILTGSLTLFGKEKADSKTLYYKFLEKYNIDLIEKYNRLYQGNFYVPFYYQQQLKQKTEKICSKYNIRNKILA